MADGPLSGAAEPHLEPPNPDPGDRSVEGPPYGADSAGGLSTRGLAQGAAAAPRSVETVPENNVSKELEGAGAVLVELQALGRGQEDKRDLGAGGSEELPKPTAEAPLPKLSYFELYRYATASSYALMALATVAAAANGCVVPLMNWVIGIMASVVTDWANNPAKYPGDALFQALVINLIKLAALGVTALVAGFLQTYLWMIAAENQTRKIREEYFQAIIRQEMGYFDSNPTGEIATRIASDINQMYDGMAEKVGNVGRFERELL